MATLYWEGKATAVAQLVTVTVGGTLAGETFTISVGGDAIASHTDATTAIADTVAALVAAWNASTHPWATGITAADASPDITLTADTAGVPFTVTLNTPGGAATFAQATTTANAGPNDWSTADNWSTGAVPVANDDVILANTDVNICWGMDQSAVDLDSLTIRQTYTGRIGLRETEFATSADGETTVTTKREYRTTYLDIESTLCDIGAHSGPGSPVGSGRIKIDLGDHACTATIHNTSRTQVDSGLPAVRLLFNNAASVLHVRKAPGAVGIATDEPGEASTLSKVSISADDASTVVDARGVTVTTWEQYGGRNAVEPAAAITTVTVDGGTLAIEGSQAVTTLNVSAGTVHANSTGTITTANVNGGELDLSENTEARTITTVNMLPGAQIRYDKDVVTLTNKITSNEARVVLITCADG